MPTLARSIINSDEIEVELVRRFWARVRIEPNGCLTWTGYIHGGYGRIRAAGRIVLTHRFAYELLVGPVPTELQLDHLCRNRACCNPEHLEIVTGKVNAERGAYATRTHCPAGHLLAGANLLTRADRPGQRECRQCSRIRKRAYKARLRSAS